MSEPTSPQTLLNRQLHDVIAGALQQQGMTYSGIQQAVRDVQALYAAPLPCPSDEATREAIAKAMAKWLGYKWEGLNDYSVADRGFSLFSSGLFQGGRPDLLNFADIVLAALRTIPTPAQATDDIPADAEHPVNYRKAFAAAQPAKSAPVRAGSLPSGESDPPVMPDCAGADTRSSDESAEPK